MIMMAKLTVDIHIRFSHSGNDCDSDEHNTNVVYLEMLGSSWCC